MKMIADLHIHSRFPMATSKEARLKIWISGRERKEFH